MPDPAQVDDASGEWFELYNSGPDSVKLAGWSIATGSSSRVSLDSAKSIAPGGFLVVTRTPSQANGGIEAGQILSSGWSLPNSSGAMRLFDPGGTVRDSVLWGSGWPLKPGHSVERTGARCDGASLSCWQASTARFGLGDYGTPNGRNSQDTTRQELEGAIVGIRTESGKVQARVWNRGLQDWQGREVAWRAGGEIRQNLSCRSGDTCLVSLSTSGIDAGNRLRVTVRLPGDGRPVDDTAGVWLFGEAGRVQFSEVQASSPSGQPEWIELSQATPSPFDLSGWSLGDTLQRHPFAPGTVLPTGGHLVLSPDCAGLRAAWRLPSMPCAEVAGWPRLSQVEDLLILRDEQGNVQDSLAWSSAFWGAWPAGKSRERRSRSAATQDAANWVASPDALGATPGWAFGATPGWSETGTKGLGFSLGSKLFSPGDLQVAGTLGMSLSAPPDWKVTVSVFDLDRRRVRTLLDGPVPANGALEWDGRNAAGRLCPMGTYLILVEAKSREGAVTARREWVVLGRRL
ncbi:MAG: hypothetical protein RL318_985 [Fibrobacterota bacterium]